MEQAQAKRAGCGKCTRRTPADGAIAHGPYHAAGSATSSQPAALPSPAPNSFLARLFKVGEERFKDASIANCAVWTPIEEDGRKRPSILELCQPDASIESAEAQIAVEIKSASKSSLKQVLKYAALMGDRGNGRLIHKLVYVAPYQDFSSIGLARPMRTWRP